MKVYKIKVLKRMDAIINQKQEIIRFIQAMSLATINKGHDHDVLITLT